LKGFFLIGGNWETPYTGRKSPLVGAVRAGGCRKYYTLPSQGV